MRGLICAVAVVWLMMSLTVACSRDIQNAEAVKEGVMDYLKARTAQTGLDVNMLQIDVTSVSFGRDEARATVAFRPKSGPAASPMLMNYTLDRKGNKWVVRGHAEGANPHGADGGTGELPPGHPPVDGTPPPGSKQ